MKELGRLAVLFTTLLALLAAGGGIAHGATWTVTHEELTQGADFRPVSGPITWSYGYWAGSGNSTVIVTMRDARTGWAWKQVHSTYCPSQSPYCYSSGRVDVPAGFSMASVVVTSQASDGVSSPQSGWVYLPVADLHCGC
jgi:hypothetical protein